ncbi:MAG: Hsp33 family molecular chaperone HslO [Desulfobacterium sp.]|jgi:molecular chaperone Hsp33|nr:Hsp33 family molecular chaperone HslO [Desulfobacterium sp.]
MIKKDIYNGQLKEQLKASARDRLHRFMLADGMVRGAIVRTTRMVNEMRANHGLGGLETLVLGQAYIAAALLTANLKARDRVSLTVQCSGPIKGFDVESNVFGEVRGYLKAPGFSSHVSPETSTLSSLFGAGFLTVTKYLEEAKQPYSGQVVLEYGTLAEDLANYFLTSEQTPTAFSLSVHFDEAGEVTGAGGLFLQAMPGADDRKVAEAQAMLKKIDSLGQSFADNQEPDTLVSRHFKELNPRLLEGHRVEFFCRCSEKKMNDHLALLPRQDIVDILDNGPFPVELRCHNCNSVYHFTRQDIEKLHNNRK